ncbi:hypothetical protein DA075_14740 [Methylobacterium currus]|uniref:Uncharacterized protein n=1 Tax=Methylobacterium currus TaxID=2051553 RepID=A0A2R4WKE3_9HYPH|nr:hypothetical protein [Methylobacterium currus]AWB22024.1 hypothetical protein DA075_14740 [Methylobacterium currus]
MGWVLMSERELRRIEVLQMERFNARLARVAVRVDDRHRPLGLSQEHLGDVLAWREQRHAGRDLALSYERQRVILEDSDLTRGVAGRYGDTYQFADGRLEVRWQGVALPYRMFDKDQRVTQAAIVENKRLSEVLAYVKDRQDELRPPWVKTNSEKAGYVKRGRAAVARPARGGAASAQASPAAG